MSPAPGWSAAMLIPGLPVAGHARPAAGHRADRAGLLGDPRSALLPEILPPGSGYVLGRSMLRIVAQAAQIVGYGVGGLLLAALSPRGALAADAVSFLASAMLLRSGGHPPPARPGQAPTPGRWPGTRWPAPPRAVLRHQPTRRILLFAWAVPVCEIAPEALATPYATHIGPARPGGRVPAYGGHAGRDRARGFAAAARVLSTRAQRRIIVPSALLAFWAAGRVRRQPRAAGGDCPASHCRGARLRLGGGRAGRPADRAPHRRNCAAAPSPCPAPG